jgi:hypothetical protein
MAETHVSIQGRQTKVPVIQADGHDIVTFGRWLRVASIKDEEYCELTPENPERLIACYRELGGDADLFTFSQRIPDVALRYDYPLCWDNAAIVKIESYARWLESLGQVTRRNIRLAAKRGVTVAAVPFDDEFVRGIHALYNETPIRHGRPFWHYGKDVDTVRADNATFLDRSEFIGAYFEGKLIGFIKMVYVGEMASIMQILAMNAHQDKRPTNALLAKAVEICAAKSVPYLKYCKYVYHNNHADLLTDFKRRNGFQQVDFPKYFVPLTLRGRVSLALRLQLSWSDWLPGSVVSALLNVRAKYHAFAHRSPSLSTRV